MKIDVLGCSGGSAPGVHPSCFLFEGGVTVDAGALAAALPLSRQRALTDVFLTHAHLDHVRDLPLTLINRGIEVPALTLHGSPTALDVVRTHLFNWDIWFDGFTQPSEDSPMLRARPLEPGETREVAGLRFTAFDVPHTVRSLSYHVDDGETAVILNGDTGGGGIFRQGVPGGSPLRAVFLEASFPNRQDAFADVTGHLTPARLGAEIADLPDSVAIYVTHMKPGYEDEITEELHALGRPNLFVCPHGEVVIG